MLAIVLVGASSVGVEFRLLDTGEPFRSLERTSLLYGSVEFRIRTPEGTETHGLRVLVDSVTPNGNEVTLCESAGDSFCVVEFSHIARRRLRIDYDLVTPGDGRRRISGSIATLHAHSGLEYSSEENVVVEHTRALGIPPDHVTRGIRYETTRSRGSETDSDPVRCRALPQEEEAARRD